MTGASARRRSALNLILTRLLGGIVSVWGVATIVFMMTRLIGDPVHLMLPSDATPEQVQEMAQFLGLDKPLIVQYGVFMLGLLRFDFGESYYWRESASAVVMGRLGATLALAAVSFVVTMLLALPAALLAAYRQGRFIDQILTGAASIGIAVPQFWLGPLLIIGFAVYLQVTPASGAGGPLSFVLPVATLAAGQIAILFMLARAAFAKELWTAYVDEARAKGAGGLRLMLVHVFPNAGLHILTLAGVILANLIAGDIIVERIFAWPGIGQLFLISVGGFDFPVVQAITIIYSLFFIGLLILVDTLYRLIDPRTEAT